MQVLVVDGRPGVYTWSEGFKTCRGQTLLEQASKSEEDLLRVCLWLENQGQIEEAVELMERILRYLARAVGGRQGAACG